ncbi:hypothetical protein GCM10023329_55750 [Streptomyces sanyensis]|uniref:Uncharacterized protein n=1 Tax=Streptomyces sanyensis TaxID=568869 RepID=A0ABP9BIG5_9ACTN
MAALLPPSLSQGRYFRYLRYLAGQRPGIGSGRALPVRYLSATPATGPVPRKPGPVAHASATATPSRYLDHAPDQGGSGGSGGSGADRKGRRKPRHYAKGAPHGSGPFRSDR